MMMAGFDHPKLKRLARLLAVEDATAIGYLELLWLHTMRHAPQGDIGKWGDEDIADACRVPNTRKPSEFVQALLDSRWLDKHSQHRLLVHDWHDHAPAWLKAKLLREGLEFFTSSPETLDLALDSAPSQPGSQSPTEPPTEGPLPVLSSQVRSGQAKPGQKTARRRKADATQTPGAIAFDSYAKAYETRYKTAPVRNAKVNGQFTNLVKRLGEDAAPVAAFYLTHQSALYVRSTHAVDLLLRDAEALRTQWATGRRMTETAARQADRTGTMGQHAQELIEESRRGK